jgi:pimeloyl-ACP methyl ester carboxylesterase
MFANFGQIILRICKMNCRKLNLFFFLSVCLTNIFLLTGCLKSIPYESEQLQIFFERKENLQLTFETDKGKQVAFYVPPLIKPDSMPEKIAILYPGINAVALGWWRFIRLEDDPGAGYLLIDYPGRGLSEGQMNPEKNYKNTEGALEALAAHFKTEQVDAELSLMGHSFGTGAALQFAARQKVSRVVLVAPFDTLRNGVAQRSVILAILMPVQIDNVALLRTILAGDEKPAITIIHGSKDASLPVEMGRKLADVNREAIEFHEIPEGDHVSILTSHRDTIFHSLLGIDN